MKNKTKTKKTRSFNFLNIYNPRKTSLNPQTGKYEVEYDRRGNVTRLPNKLEIQVLGEVQEADDIARFARVTTAQMRGIHASVEVARSAMDLDVEDVILPDDDNVAWKPVVPKGKQVNPRSGTAQLESGEEASTWISMEKISFAVPGKFSL